MKMGILDEGYGIIPKLVMMDQRLDVYAKAVLAYLLSFTGKGKIECWPAINTIAEHLQISRGKVIQSIQILGANNYLKKDKLFSDDPMKKHNRYKLIVLESPDDLMVYLSNSRSAPDGLSKDSGATFEGLPVDPNNHSINNHNNNNHSGSPKPPNDVFSLVSVFSDLYHSQYGSPCIMWKKDYGMIKTILKNGAPREEVKRRIESYFKDEYWFTREGVRTLPDFIKHYNEILPSKKAKAPAEKHHIRGFASNPL